MYEQERDSFKARIVFDYQKATNCHQEEKKSLLHVIESLKSHYHESYEAQKSHFQIRKDEIINQVKSSFPQHKTLKVQVKILILR